MFFSLYADSNKDKKGTFYFFYSYACPHCKHAHPFIKKLEKKYSQLSFKEIEIALPQHKDNLKKFQLIAKKFDIRGVPAFILGDLHIVGFRKGETESLLENMIMNYLKSNHKKTISTNLYVPIIGNIDAKLVSLPSFTFIIGLLDGINPCAMWVLMFLLTLLVNAKSRKRLIMIGSIFVVSSGVVYFLFMTAWLNIFMFIGMTKYVTYGLGIVAVFMGLINLKEYFFFKKGISLMIPESAKPKLFKKMRGVMNTKSVIWSILGTVTLAFFVNLIELACTIGLPAIYTRILSIQKISVVKKYFYMGLYNVYYVIPLAIIVLLFIFTMGKHRFQEKHAKVLKLVSGFLMLALGLILVIKPDLLIFS